MHFIQTEFIWFMASVFALYWALAHPVVVRGLGGAGGVVVRALRPAVAPLAAIFTPSPVGRVIEALLWPAVAWVVLRHAFDVPGVVAGPAAALAAVGALRLGPLGWALREENHATVVEALGLSPYDGRVGQNVLLAVASAFFYGYVHPYWLLLLYFSSVLDYFVGRAMERRPDQRSRLLMVSLAGNLGMLGLFKYYNFFVENVKIALASVGLHANFWMLDILLPVGISFYTFQTMSYTIDIYRGRLAPRRNFLDYVCYVSFFPQLVAGPIERAEALLPQMERPRTFDREAMMSGFGLALWGVFKKVCIADTLAPYVDEVFMTREPAFIMVLMAGFGFGVQMLADFSGYTDIARGTARMLGFHLVENFDRPYHAQSTPEFWRKWHISLSSWVGDYVYTPLLRAGKPGPMNTVFAMMTTFFVIGLWHGASWNFIALGLYNGLWMVIYTFAMPMIPKRVRNVTLAGGAAWLFHTLVVLQPTGLMFREVSLTRVWQHLSQPWFSATPEEWYAAAIVGSFAVLGTLPLNLSFWMKDHALPKLRRSPWFLPIQTTFWSFEVLAIFVFYRDASQDFIYFQF